MIVTDSNDNLKGIFTQLVYFQIQLENLKSFYSYL